MNFQDIKKICAVGTGAMGAGTALCFALAGYDVALYGRKQSSLDAGQESISRALSSLVKHGFVAADDVQPILDRIQLTTDLNVAATNADFVIESIAEDLALKQDIFAKLDAICPPHAIFATNTSAINPTDIAQAVQRKEQFVVTHFFNPPHLMPTVEVVPSADTSPQTMDAACAILTHIGKEPARLNFSVPGFVGNRIQAAMLREAFHIVASGIASAEDVDSVVRGTLGLRLAITGPLESADLGGLDIFESIFRTVGRDLSADQGPPEFLARAVAENRLGAKTGQGTYEWPAEKLAAIRERRENEIIKHLRNRLSRKDGIAPPSQG